MDAERAQPGKRLLIVDDFALIRESLAARLAPLYDDIRCASSLPSILRVVDGTWSPDLILLNYGTGDSARLLQVGLDLKPQPGVIVFGLSNDRDVVRCAELGATGLHLRSESFEHLLELMHEASNGRPHCSAEASAILVGQVYLNVSGDADADSAMEPLTAREAEILALLEDGLTNQQIALRLSVTVHTVKNHVHNLLNKLGVGSRAEASKFARAMKYTGPAGLRATRHRPTG